MRTLPLMLVALFGCSVVPVKTVMPTQTTNIQTSIDLDPNYATNASVQRLVVRQNSTGISQPPVWIHWNPSLVFTENSEYVLLSSTDFVNWTTLYVGTDTNAFSPRKDWEFYMLYSTNTETGESYPSSKSITQ